MKVRVMAVSGAFAVACGAHDDVTPLIAVQPGAAARAMALLGHAGPNGPRPATPSADAGDDDATEAAPGRIAFSCLEARGAFKALARVPCRVALEALDATPPDAPTELVFETGRASVEAPPGKYRVTASRGLEYTRATWEVEVVSGEVAWGPNEGAAVLRRVVDTRGYLAADLGSASPPAVMADAAAGIEVVLGDVASVVQGAKLEDTIEPFDPVGDLGVVEAWADRDSFLAGIASKRPATAIGSPPARTYVRVDDDGALATWSPAREADLVHGLRDRRDVVLTTGPFLRVTANGAPIGGVARATVDQDVEVHVHVECAPWITVDRVSIVRASGGPVDSRSIALHAVAAVSAVRSTAPPSTASAAPPSTASAAPPSTASPSRAPPPTTTDARAADLTLHLHVTADDAFVVVVDSTAGAGVQGDGASHATRAMTGAIWIDADGDGESLGRTEIKR